ncbi:hypothetical protein G9A89_021061 [Geosiphon pyriformis]|nr:hypothetical protein G9A89_021061 [Geosiphon pyriformis]
MDMETITSSFTSKKKTPKGAFHGPADISLSKFGPGNSVYSDVDSLSDDNKNIGISGVNDGSLLGLAATTPKTKQINTGAVFGFSLSSPNFYMNDNEVVLPSCLSISLEKKWIDPKIIKTTMEVMEMTASLARKKGININSNLKRQGIHSDWTVVIKKIPIDTPKEIIVAALTEFDSVCVAMAVEDHNTWASRDQFRALLFTLLVGTTAHDLGTLLDRESAYYTELIFGGVKLSWTRLDLVHCKNCGCFGHFSVECDAPIAPSAKPSKSVKRVTSGKHYLQQAKLYTKKGVLISCSAAFGDKSWTQVVSLASSSGGSPSGSDSGSEFFFSDALHDKESMLIDHVDFSIHNCLTSLEHSLELLANQVSSILCKLNGVELVPLVSASNVRPPVGFASVKLVLNADMILDVLQLSFLPSSSIVESKTVDLGLNSSKVFTFKVSGLESKMVALEVSIGSILGKLDLLGMTNLSKQDDIVYWHKESNNMISIVTETKLRSDIRQANQDWWKFKIKNVDDVQWLSFKDHSSAKLLIRSDMFEEVKDNNNLNMIWRMLRKTMVQAVNKVFSKIWYIVENALEKNRKLWLVLQDMCKAYDSVSWFVAKSGRIKVSGGKTFFLAAGTFIDNMIWVSSSYTSIQYILNIASLSKPSMVQAYVDVSLLEMWSDYIEVYTDRSLKCAGSVKVVSGVAVYFLAVDADIRVAGLLSSTLTELQAVVLALKSVLSLCSVVLYSDSQAAINACISKASVTMPDFHNQCWIKRLHIDNLLESNFLISFYAGENLEEISDLYWLICHAHWKAGPGFDRATATIWHLDLHMLFGFTSRKSANLCTYLMKAVYRKRLYNKSYSEVLCLLCGEVELSDYVFTCSGNSGLCRNILMSISGLICLSTSAVLHLLSLCSSNMSLYTAVCKNFVVRDWYAETVLVFERQKKTTLALVEYIKFMMELHHTKVYSIALSGQAAGHM